MLPIVFSVRRTYKLHDTLLHWRHSTGGTPGTEHQMCLIETGLLFKVKIKRLHQQAEMGEPSW